MKKNTHLLYFDRSSCAFLWVELPSDFDIEFSTISFVQRACFTYCPIFTQQNSYSISHLLDSDYTVTTAVTML